MKRKKASKGKTQAQIDASLGAAVMTGKRKRPKRIGPAANNDSSLDGELV